MPSSGEFRLSITRALTDQLIGSLAELAAEPLTAGALDALAPKPGVYQLYLHDDLVYVGKADASLPQRLGRHHRKLSGRENINVTDVRFAALYVYEDLKAVAPETLLIERYKSEGLAAWNFNGFGSNDPGQNRDQTVFPAKHFDVQYPARLGWICDGIGVGTYSAAEFAAAIKTTLPYVFRYQMSPVLNDVDVNVPQANMTADQLFELLALALRQRDSAWRIIALPGYVIMYTKSGSYPSARKEY